MKWGYSIMSVEYKGLLDTIINNFLEIMNIKPFQGKINEYLSSEYKKGLDKADKEIVPKINFEPNNQDIEFLNEYAFQNLQKHADELGDSLRQEIQRGILNKDTPTDLKRRIKDVFKDKKYTNRLKTVMRTERVRANNMGIFDGAKQAEAAGVKIKKWLDVTVDDVTTDICHREHGKYGNPDDAIPLDQDFVVKVGNKTYRALHPPFHINCRTVLRTVRA